MSAGGLNSFYPTWHFALICPLTYEFFNTLFIARLNEHNMFLCFQGFIYINWTGLNTFLWLGVNTRYIPWYIRDIPR